MAEKIYVGKGKEFGQYGNIGFSINIDAIMPHVYEYEGKRYVKLSIGKMAQVDKYGKTHTVSVATWKPDGERAPLEKPKFIKNLAPDVEFPTEDIDPNDIPF